ncbi:MAG: hypothetical protein K2R98_14730 [Gemmataceae bacterium]|nr:hypothetical protein [Gemmataceae bacterium]
MRHSIWLAAFVLALSATGGGQAAEPSSCPPPETCFLSRLAPVGGWHPDGGGLLHWWKPHCFPSCGAPDDYCRKPLPRPCWPPYPPYFTYGPPEICHSTNPCPR